jgi:glycosyltransferase involved in cell wall biosynthesis
MSSGDLKVALVHDWLTGMRGGEKVLEVLCDFFPSATLFTIFHDRGAMSPIIEGMEIRTSWIAKLPLADGHFRSYLPLFPKAIESFDFHGYDLIISTSHCVAKGAIPSADALHISYIHTPMRYIWEMYPHYLGREAGPIRRLAGAALASYLRRWDVASCPRVHYFIANSENVRRRIQLHYRREAEVIYPPVDGAQFYPSKESGDYFLIVTALVPYKQVNLAIEAFNKLGLRLVIVGEGPEKKKLQAMAKPNIEFLPWQGADSLRNLYSRCRALIFPGEEDFGIVPLEAQSCGRPVIAYGRGGVLETVIPVNPESAAVTSENRAEATGLFFYESSAEALVEAVRAFDRHSFHPEAIRRQALRFDKPVFTRRLGDYLRMRIAEKFEKSVGWGSSGGDRGE